MNKWYCILALVAMLCFCTVAQARNIEMSPRVASGDEGGGDIGEVIAGYGGATGCGDVVYRNTLQSGYYYRPYPGYRDHDDLHLENGGDVVTYSIATFGSTVSGSMAGSPYDVHTGLWTDSLGDPDWGIPLAEIAGTGCDFLQVPCGHVTLTCNVKPDVVAIPDALWSAIEFSTDNSGWKIAGELGTIGWTGDWFAEYDYYYGVYNFYWFGGCPVCGAMVMDIVVHGQDWACCDVTTYACDNIQESCCDPATSVYTEGTLCNDLDPPCSEGGACCNTLTGVCTNTFASLCDGYMELFEPGQDCATLEGQGWCEDPEGVPTVTQWGMFVLVAILLAGLTIKFSRRRTVTA